MTDYELMVKIKNGDSEAKGLMWKKYDRLICKMKYDLNRRKEKLADKGAGLDTSDYDIDCFEYFNRALDYIKLEKIPEEKKNTWTAYIALYQYLSIYNRDTISHYIRDNKPALSYEAISTCVDKEGHAKQSSRYEAQIIENNPQYQNNPEETFETTENRRALNKAIAVCMNEKFSDNQKQIWEMRSSVDDDGKKYSIPTICDKIGISRKEYNNDMKYMKETLSSVYNSYMSESSAEKIFFQ